MLIEVILALLFGTFFGIITGLIPGLHNNNISTILLGISSFLLLFISPIALIVFISSMAITNTFVDFIPSVYLGAPDEDSAMSVMPGHYFLLKGRAHYAVLLTLVGSCIAILLLIIILPIFFFAVPKTYEFVQRMMAWFLIWISILLIFTEKKSKKMAIVLFLLSGFLGIASLNIMENSLLPLLSGLFGSSTIIYSMSKNAEIPKQKIEKIKIKKLKILKPVIATAIISPLCSFFPGLGSSQAAVIGSALFKKMSRSQFLILLGSINTLVMSVSFAVLYLIGKPRTGAAGAIQQIADLSLSDLKIIFISMLLSTLIASVAVVKISKFFAKNLGRFNYQKISLAVLIFLFLMIIFFSGFYGLIIFIASTILGLFSIHSGVRRSFLMGSLLIPAIIFYLPF